MISIIICSRTTAIAETHQVNIQNTIGVDYELIIINNSANKLSIFEAYNLGVQKSKGDILCFMHDDILFHTENWGSKVIAHFDDPQTGAIGIAGTPYIAKMPGSWWAGDLVNQQLLVRKNDILVATTKVCDGVIAKSKPVVVLDGIWLCIRKKLFDKLRFDTETYKGYHFYDIDICLQIFNLKYKLYCIFDIDLEHLSLGNMNKQWIENAISMNKKWRKMLPASVVDLTTAEQLAVEFKNLKELTLILITNNYTALSAYKFALKKLMQFGGRIITYKKGQYFFYFLLKYLRSITLKKSNEKSLR
ncbi:glycosyltransferase [Pedobacter mucosus]|uniref:glycosyltransferase n=1 Tax=Pedobacter mucosus TaxID=2895286 RepID=UPI001EE3A2F2|nr:glycosyltransferase [Pedobacter mucosus]UKT64398.1 glycosyltransferase family protein [Pedobacter mucosus]